MDNLIFTTKELSQKPAWGLWVFSIIMPILCFIALPLAIAAIISGIFIGISIIGFLTTNNSKKSYIDIYEDKISGIDARSMSTTFFELRYHEIIRLDHQDGTVRIHVQNGYYVVNAPNCEQKVINIIEEQKNYFLTKCNHNTKNKSHTFLQDKKRVTMYLVTLFLSNK